MPALSANDNPVGLENGVGAEGSFAQSFLHVQAGFGLEPLPELVYQRDGGDGRTADKGGQTDKVQGDYTLSLPLGERAAAFSAGAAAAQEGQTEIPNSGSIRHSKNNGSPTTLK